MNAPSNLAVQALPQNPDDGAVQDSRSTAPIVLQVIEVARRHVLLILSVIAAVVIAALVLTLLATPQYTAETRIEIAREQANVTNVEGLEREGSSQALEYYATQHALLGARSLAERVSRRLRLVRNDAFLEAYQMEDGSGLLTGEADTRPSRAQMRDRERAVVDTLLANVNIRPVRGSALVDVAYTSPNPQLSADIASAWVEEFIRQSMDRRFDSTTDARAFLETRLEALRQRLETSERELVNYARNQDIVRLSESRTDDGRTEVTQTLVSTDLQALNTELARATAERITAEGRRDSARTRGQNDVSLSNPALNQLRVRRSELASEYAGLLQRFEPEYPEARAVQQQIANVDNAIATEERRIVAGFDSTYNATLRREQMLRARVDALLGRLDQQNRASIQYNIYQREVDTNRQLYDSLLQRYKEIGVAGVGTNNIAVVDEAEVPLGPSSPNLMLNLALAFLVGVAMAGGLVLLLENLDEAIRQPQQVTDKLKIPLLGAVPVSADVEPREAIVDPKSVLAEAYMSVCTNLGFTTDHGAPRSMSITSTSPSEGKSTTSLAISTMLTRTGRSVILLDVDLRLPALAKALGLPNTQGVSNFLSGDNDWRRMIQSTGLGSLVCLTSGPVPPSAPELLSTDRLQQLVAELTQVYDHVVIDGPPMLALADARLISRTVEGTILVIEANRTPARAAEATIKLLRGQGIRLLGAVLTKYKAQRSGYGYGYSYTNEFAYGRDREQRAAGAE